MLRFMKYCTSSIACSNPETTNVMSEIRSFLKKRIRYDGRTKKRKWEERRSDYAKEGAPEAQEVTDDKKTKIEQFERIKKRKYVLMLGYSGVDYYGMQRNPHSRTIEEDLIAALLKAELITQEAFDQIQNIQFQRAARTDKGVSAVRQIVSLKLPESVDVKEINKHLPSQIRVFAAKRVTKGFNSKSACDARTYSYMLPTVAFSPYQQNADQTSYRISQETLSTVNELLKNYLGTKNYHNFTSKKKASDPSAKRYMFAFECEPPFVRKDVEFAVMKVRGQSFMLHQIRKMVGLIIAIMRGHTTEDIFKEAFSEEKVNIPRAPGLGLVLEYVHYDRYNTRYGEDGMHEKLVWDEVEREVNEFKEDFIFPTIVNTEVNEKPMVEWLDKLFKHGFHDVEDENEGDDGSDNEGEDGSKDVNELDGDVKKNSDDEREKKIAV